MTVTVNVIHIQVVVIVEFLGVQHAKPDLFVHDNQRVIPVVVTV